LEGGRTRTPAARPVEREILGKPHVGPVERHDQKAVRRPRPDPRDFGQLRLDLVIGHARQRLVAQLAVDEPAGERAQGGGLAVGHAAGPELLRVDR
jgi:hypothetical protein